MNVLLCCHRLCICYSKYNPVSLVSSRYNNTALVKDCMSLCIIYYLYRLEYMNLVYFVMYSKSH